ncbi:MAG: hypothetical protein IPM24_04705 [Bryobacterales bacterium]|nr:hypothetical protein [Bryobacterales bacterium]
MPSGLRSAVLCLLMAGTVWTSSLSLVRVQFHQMEDGPALPGDFAYVPGEMVYFSTLVEGYKVTRDRVKLRWEVRAVDADGVLLDEPASGTVEEEIRPQDKEWRPRVRYQFLAPPLALPGTYTIRVDVTDEMAQTKAQIEAPFRLRGRPIERSDTLAIQNLGFFRSEEDDRPLTVAGYRPGETVWVRFDLTGYKFTAGNRFRVEYAVKVLNSAGEVLFAQDEPTAQENSSFYPQMYQPCIFNLSLDPDIAAAGYAIEVVARDLQSGNETTGRAAFRVE